MNARPTTPHSARRLTEDEHDGDLAGPPAPLFPAELQHRPHSAAVAEAPVEILGVAAANAVDACPPLLGHHHPHAGSTFSDGPCAAAPHAPRSLFTTLLVEEAATTAWHLCQEDGAPHSDDIGLNAVDLPSFFPISPSKAAHRHSGHAGSVTSASGEGEVPWPSSIDRGGTLGWEVFASEAPSAELGPSSPAAAADVINGAPELPGGGRLGRCHGPDSSTGEAHWAGISSPARRLQN